MAELAGKSGDFIRPYFGQQNLAIETKADASPVTLADRGAEELMRALIKRHYPSHGIIGEELGSENPDAEFVWVLDPIDGTKSFISGVPLFGTLIGLLHDGQPIVGAIHQPILRQFLIGDGNSTTLNGAVVHCRATSTIEEMTLLTSDPLNPAKFQNGPRYDALAGRAKLVRTWGDAYGYLLVACGWADATVDPIMNPWDIAALIPVIRGAGGVITDWHGGNPYPAASTIAAGTPELHGMIVAALN